MSKTISIYILSSSIGITAEQLAKASLAQYSTDQFVIHRIKNVVTKELVDEALKEIPTENSMIIFTLVFEEVAAYLVEEARKKGIEIFDAMSPVLQALTRLTGEEPKQVPGAYRALNEDYFDRIDAIEFAIRCDDGKDVRGFMEADVVLLGISRTSKTPTSMALAHRNIKVANLPLVPEVLPPDLIYELDPRKIVGLTTDITKLEEIRNERLKALGLSVTSNYAQDERIKQEIEYSDGIYKKLGCLVINTAKRSVDETASLITEHLREQGLIE
jgi:hypothetical protein